MSLYGNTFGVKMVTIHVKLCKYIVTIYGFHLSIRCGFPKMKEINLSKLYIKMVMVIYLFDKVIMAMVIDKDGCHYHPIIKHDLLENPH